MAIKQFYECDNPRCKLRFPGTVGHPRWSRCPACRSSVHLVTTVQSADEHNYHANHDRLSHVDAMLDNVRSAWNVGSIFRTADGTGIGKLYLCGITPSPDNSKVSKTALGAEAGIPWEKYNNGVLLANQLKSAGSQLWTLEDVPGAKALFDVEQEEVGTAIVLVVGNEVSGVDPGIIELSDMVIGIPMLGKKQSYNVAVAFGIATSFLLYRQIFSHGSRNKLPNT
jgi:23S rRNA (guanosine2251-2'-O)-methyltransferase